MGGYYQAIATGLYSQRPGIECEGVRQGGPQPPLNISQTPCLAGRVRHDSCRAASRAFSYVRIGAPFYTIAAIFQKGSAGVLIVHPDTRLRPPFEKLQGRTLLDRRRRQGDLLALPAPEVRASPITQRQAVQTTAWRRSLPTRC